MKLFSGQNKRMAPIISLLLCSAFIFQVVTRTLYLHAHQIANGQIIIHAHPYDKSSDKTPFKSHHHSGAGYVFWGQYNILFSLIAVILAILLLSKSYKYLKNSPQKYANGIFLFRLSRAPPCL